MAAVPDDPVHFAGLTVRTAGLDRILAAWETRTPGPLSLTIRWTPPDGRQVQVVRVHITDAPTDPVRIPY